MASVGTSSTDFIFGDDLDATFDALEEDEQFENFLDTTVDEVRVYDWTFIAKGLFFRRFCTRVHSFK